MFDTKEGCNSILIIEDDKDIRDSIKEALELEGYDVDTSVNGKEALEFLRQASKPCIVLLDMHMPVMGGREFLDILMKDAGLSPIPVIVISSVATKENTMGAAAYIRKPADLNVILNTVKKYCYTI